ncbi:hypothetical protein ACIA8K_17330 [Catenuloplanes sp. NPDC051500]|uniref:hypothetical protein n=1 Tax=Catenuloplanes sp. NPDC051500 TaxID=3363959 RepID=UPI0037BCE219
MINRILRTLGVAVVSAIVATALAPAAAHAATYTPTGLCGAGYTVKRSAKLPGATVYHLANGSWQCVVTIKTANVGKATYVGAGVLLRGATGWALDDGTYRYYAGPVKQKGACGSVRGLSGTGAKSWTC